ncbi:MAG TPA: hypothetical protein VHX62_12090 [Solirubrobacteraceae bacterium]|jgi:hypothetical protein|nr:hypothetical protein [Solirubrobacteraceae bacterium]
MRVLDERQAAVVRRVCEAIVPGCDRTGAELYVDALLAGMPEEARDGIVGAFESLAEAVDAGETALRKRQFTPEFGMARAFACEAFYSDFVAPGRAGPGAWEEIDFRFPLADRINKDWSFLGVQG